MEANTGNRASPHWRALHEAAVLEIDVQKLPQRIAQAQSAIMDRIEDLNHSCDNSESQALMDALNVLRDLRKMADAEGKAQNYRDADKLPIRASWSQTHVPPK
jgi:hypothetical protein